MPSVIAAQMYTLRNFTKTPADIATTMKKVRDIGYEAVQLSALGPIPQEELKKILDENKLVVAATHVPYDKMRDNPQSVIDEHKFINCAYTAIGGLPQDYRNAAGYSKFAKEASAVAKKLKDGGLTWGYHNHSFELEKFNGRTGLEILYSESDASVFTAEIDTYWIQHGGGDPAQWIRSLKGRIPLVHLKDMVVKDNQPIMAEVGEGNLNWPEILKACKEAGVKWYIVEQDTCQRDPFESLAISLKNLKKMGLN
ncbi:MAG TPA: sugar phosphate isomerase/epimerase [Planctomycetota bacterium]|nr:sugar phosphate isomerase/epimerase [Planctomycetota bacterium]